jgi:hypothetical protein
MCVQAQESLVACANRLYRFCFIGVRVFAFDRLESASLISFFPVLPVVGDEEVIQN